LRKRSSTLTISELRDECQGGPSVISFQMTSRAVASIDDLMVGPGWRAAADRPFRDHIVHIDIRNRRRE
jgi:hypothetical protein